MSRIGHIINIVRNSTTLTIDVIFSAIQELSGDNSQRFATLLESLWKHCNLKLWQEVIETIAKVIDRAFHLIEDRSLANTHDMATKTPHVPPQHTLDSLE